MKTRMKRMWCSVLLLYSMVTIWSFRNSIHPFSFEEILNGKYAVFSAPNVSLFPGTFLLTDIFTLMLLVLLAYFNVESNENGVQQDYVSIYCLYIPVANWLCVAVLLIIDC